MSAVLLPAPLLPHLTLCHPLSQDGLHHQQASVNMQSLAESVMEELIDHMSRGLCHQVHRAAKLGYLSLEESAAQE